MPMHKAVKPPIKIIHAEVMFSPPSSKEQEIPGFLQGCFLLLYQPHPVRATFCWWPALGQPVLQTRKLKHSVFVVPLPVHDGIIWRRDPATVLLRVVPQQPSDLGSISKLVSAHFLAFEMKLPLSPGITMHLPFPKGTKKSKFQEKVLDSPQADVRDPERERQTFTAGPLSN